MHSKACAIRSTLHAAADDTTALEQRGDRVTAIYDDGGLQEQYSAVQFAGALHPPVLRWPANQRMLSSWTSFSRPNLLRFPRLRPGMLVAALYAFRNV